jgi:20S proteasome alpha/beta subunit
MNKKEAIEILKNNYSNKDFATDLDIAIELAIKALENMGCGCDICLAHNNMKCPKMR